MKKTRKLINWLAVGSVALAMVTSLTAQTAKERTAQVVRLKGKAQYGTGNNIWQPVEIGTKLKAGHVIQTAGDSYVDILFGEADLVPSRVVVGEWMAYQPKVEQDIIRLSEDSVLAIDKLTVTETGADQVTDTQLDLRSGRVFGRVKKLSTASRYEIKAINCVAAVRGTIYNFSSGNDRVLQVLSGSVEINYTGPDGQIKSQTVPAGFQFTVSTELLTPLPPERESGPELVITTPIKCIPRPPPPISPTSHPHHHRR